MRALALVCTLNASPARSSSHLIAEQVMAEQRDLGVAGEVVRVADHDVRPGVGLDTVASTTRTLAANAAHLARLLGQNPYPAG